MLEIFEQWARRGRLSEGGLFIGIAGATWAALCLVLAAGGHAPSVALLPIERERYYLAQAGFVMPVMFFLWLLCTAVASRVAHSLGGAGTWRRAATPLAFSLSLPIVALFLLPDLVAYTLSGFDALGMLVRFTAPLSFAATLALATLAMRVSHGLASGRAFVSAAAGVVSQAVIGGVFLR